MIKREITAKLCNKNGKLNSRKIPYLAEDEPDLYTCILIATDFLPKEVSINERIYCILNDINIIPKCPICKKVKRSFIKYRGYRSTCGHHSCAMKLRYHNIVNKKKTSEKWIESKVFNRQYYIQGLEKLHEYTFPICRLKHFLSKPHIDNWLSILFHTQNIWPIFGIPKFQEIRARYNMLIYGIAKCEVCEKIHFEYSKRNGQFKKKCSSCSKK